MSTDLNCLNLHMNKATAPTTLDVEDRKGLFNPMYPEVTDIETKASFNKQLLEKNLNTIKLKKEQKRKRWGCRSGRSGASDL